MAHQRIPINKVWRALTLRIEPACRLQIRSGNEYTETVVPCSRKGVVLQSSRPGTWACYESVHLPVSRTWRVPGYDNWHAVLNTALNIRFAQHEGIYRFADEISAFQKGLYSIEMIMY